MGPGGARGNGAKSRAGGKRKAGGDARARDQYLDHSGHASAARAIRPIAIIIGSTRPGRHGEAVANWVYEIASQRSDAKFELIDLADHPLPHLDEPDRFDRAVVSFLRD